MKTEYLICFDKNNHIATTSSAFNNLLMANDNIKIKDNNITYNSNDFKYYIQSNEILDTNFIYHHITIEYECDENNIDLNSDIFQEYHNLLRAVKKILLNKTQDLEILWDDIGFICSQQAYPLIYKIENLMRKLLTKFMLINVGTKWESQNIPSKINKSKNKGKEISFGNGLLYKLDFIELATFLFEPYPVNKNIIDLGKKYNSKENVPFDELSQFIPKSNWDRYFDKLVDIESEDLSKKWNELYALRCKVAHNNYFTITEYNKVKEIVEELEPYILKAIKELNTLKVKLTEKEIISDTFISTLNGKVEDLIYICNRLSFFISKYLFINKVINEDKVLAISQLLDLIEREHLCPDFISEKHYKSLKVIIYNRNKMAHQNYEMNNEKIDELITEAILLMNYFSLEVKKTINKDK